jgi:hypothetical protein
MLQERDLRLLEALETMRVIDREQAMVVASFRSRTRANERLLALTQAGHLKRAFVGRRQAVYWQANRPLHQEKKRGDAAAEPASLFLHHQLEINRVHLLVQYSSIPFRGWWFGQWQSFQKPLSGALPLIPDGYFELSSSQGFRPAFVEVDLGTEAVPILAKKASLYLQLAASGEFSQIFGRSQFRVLLITTSDRRLQNIRQAIAKITDKIFWLGTFDAIAGEKFWTAAWLRPTGDQLQSLL